ncbi:MAG: hypothetical protein ACRD2W_19835 [Acidimicrobiales bacterium]
MPGTATASTPTPWAVRWALAGVGVILLGLAVTQIRENRTGAARDVDPGASSLDPSGAEARCADAIPLVKADVHWPVRCRWRRATDDLQGQAYPPPKGLPPYDDPRVEIYVDPAQDRASLAHAIAHELGHMHHTRDPQFVPEWLAARGLPADTRDEVWTEDYAEVFAAIFSPPADRWRAPTVAPDAAALAALRARFFADA